MKQHWFLRTSSWDQLKQRFSSYWLLSLEMVITSRCREAERVDLKGNCTQCTRWLGRGTFPGLALVAGTYVLVAPPMHVIPEEICSHSEIRFSKTQETSCPFVMACLNLCSLELSWYNQQPGASMSAIIAAIQDATSNGEKRCTSL